MVVMLTVPRLLHVGVIICDEGPVLYGYDDCKLVRNYLETLNLLFGTGAQAFRQDGSAFSIMGFINAKHGRKWLYKTREERERAVGIVKSKFLKMIWSS